MPTPTPTAGPLVRRSVHAGAVLWILGVIVFVAGMAVAQLGWTNPGYTLTQNVISDLGAVHCGPYSGRDICSPLNAVFNGAVIAMGVLLLAGLYLVASALPRGRGGTWGIVLFALTGVGAIGVGLNPEDVRIDLHLLSAALAFLGGNLALLAFGVAMREPGRWRRWSSVTIGLGVIGLAAFGLIVARAYEWGGLFAAWGEGGIERTIVVPLLIWAVLAGVLLLRTREYAPRGVGSSARST